MNFFHYRQPLPRSVVIAELVRVNRVLANALLEILEESESDQDWDIVTSATKTALQEIAE